MTKVAGEARDGKIRAELAVATHATTIPMQDGLLGALEVEVERVAPATLLLCAVKFLARPAAKEEQTQRSSG